MALGRYSELRAINEHLESIEAALFDLKGMVEDVPTQAEFDAAMTDLKASIAAAATRVVTDLQGKLAQGDPITAADLQQIADATNQAAGIDPTPVPPTP